MKDKFSNINISINIKFYLNRSSRSYLRKKYGKLTKEPEMKTEEPIFMNISFGSDSRDKDNIKSNRIRIPVGVKVEPRYWTKYQTVDDNAPDADETNAILVSMRKWAKKVHAETLALHPQSGFEKDY